MYSYKKENKWKKYEWRNAFVKSGEKWKYKEVKEWIVWMTYRTIPHGLVARIQRSHRWGPGSIPGGGVHFSTFY